MFWSVIANLIGGPLVSGLLDGYKAKIAAGNTSERIAADLAGRELAVQQREIETQAQLRIAEIGHWYEPDHLFAYTLWLYFAKLIVWDKMLGLGSTDPLNGAVGDWAGMIMIFLFGKRGIENVARILKRK